MAFGGFLALRAAASLAGIAGVVSINGFFDLGSFWPDLPQVYRDNMRFALGGENVSESAERFTLEGFDAPNAPVLILHGGRDRIFPPAQAARCAEACSHGAEIHVFPEGNHVCNNISWLYRPLVADWLNDRFSGQKR
ncbi:Alpha/beta hydrolase family protein [compost metagenome]